MATTPNYGWVTPAPTDFVTDLPADFETFADAVDADLAGLLGGTTGQVLVKNSGTDHDFDWATDPTSDVVTTAGDLIYGTAADTVTRLGIGTAGQVLQVNSGATAPEWVTFSGGGETLITSGTLSGSSVSITSIPGTYKDLKIIIRNFKPATDASNCRFRFNGDSNANRHRSSSDAASFGDTFNATSGVIAAANDDTTAEGLTIAWIYDYANTTTWKFLRSRTLQNDATTATNFNYDTRFIPYNQTNAITSFDLFPTTGNFTSGDYYVYGVN